MKIILNPTKPFYKNTHEKNIRMGNFKETGKIIEYEDEYFTQIFELLKEPIEYEKLKQEIKNNTNLNESDIIDILNYLIDEKFIILENDFKTMKADNYYSREHLYFYMLSDKINDLNKIKDKNILILGIGGIGSICLDLLARAGFENFTIVDYDNVDPSNLIRQTLYTYHDIGKSKVEVAKKQVLKINKNISIKYLNRKIETKEDIKNEIQNCDFVLCTVDKPLRIIRRLINEICVELEKPVIFCGFSEHTGMIGPFVIPHKTACLSCIEKENINNDIPLENINEVPSFGPLCSLIASITTSEIINYFLKFKKSSLKGKTLMFNMINYNSKIVKWKKSDNCERCNKNDC